MQPTHLLTFSYSQKFYKLKKESENLLSGDGAVAPPKTPTATPRGKAAKAKATGTDATPTKTPNKTPASGKRKQKATATGDGTAASKKIKQEVEADAEVEAGAGVGGTEDSATTEVKDEAIDARYFLIQMYLSRFSNLP